MLDSCIELLTPVTGKHREGDRKGCDARQADDGDSIAGASNDDGTHLDGVRTGFFETPSTNTIHPVALDHGK